MKQGLADRKCPKGTNITFTVLLTADPVPDIVWTYNGKPIESNPDRIMDCLVQDIENGLKDISYSLTIPSGMLYYEKNKKLL